MADIKLIETGYFLSRCGKDTPPEKLDVSNWNDAYMKFFYELNDDKTPEAFQNSLKNYRDHFDSHFDNSRKGWFKNGKPESLSAEAENVYNKFFNYSDEELWDHIKNYTPINIDPNTSKNLFWSFDINAFRLIGSQLISDKFTAIIELVKNCYDANATEVKLEFINTHSMENGKIIIQDNGHGMNSNDIQNSWMKVGTNKKRLSETSPKPFNRIYLGEKGIGRFAIEKIADHIMMYSKETTDSSISILQLNWAIYSDISDNEDISVKESLFTEIPNTFYSVKPNDEIYSRAYQKTNTHGTTLEFSRLKEVWTDSDITRIKKELSKFILPTAEKFQEYPFNIYVKHANDNYDSTADYEKLFNDSLKFASFNKSITFDKKNNLQEELFFNEQSGEIEKRIVNEKSFGPISMHIYYYDQYAKRRFSSAYKGQNIKLDGFKIYRDNVLSTPFVEKAELEKGNDQSKGVSKNRDVLGLDSRRYSGFFSKISSRDYLGFIEITKKDNPGIRDLTNRQEFESTSDFKEFKKFIIEQLEVIEQKLSFDKAKEREKSRKKYLDSVDIANNIMNSLETLEKANEGLSEVTKPIALKVKELIKSIKLGNKEIESLQQDLNKEREVFTRLVSLQEFAASLSHTVRNSVEILTKYSRALLDEVSDFDEENDLYEIATEVDKEIYRLMDLVNYMLGYANSGKNIEKFDISKFIIDTFNNYKKVFEDDDIKYDISDLTATLLVNHNKALLKELFDNLISNSLKSLRLVDGRKRIIKCSSDIKNNNFIITFSDNGIGIEPEIKHKIYDLRFTTTDDSGGSGIGLYKVKTSLDTLHGTIELDDPEFIEFGCTFKMTLPLDGEESD